jgi:hypothetical protein
MASQRSNRKLRDIATEVADTGTLVPEWKRRVPRGHPPLRSATD